MAATDIAPPIIVLEPGDVEAGLALSDEAGWNQTLADWSYFLSHGVVFGIRDAHRQVIAAAALLPFPPAAWISLVLVTAPWRRRGLASALFARCVEEAQARKLEAWLDATPAGAAVYEKMGFSSETGGLQRLRRQAASHAAITEAESTDDGAFRRLVDRDRRVMGFDRPLLLAEFTGRPGTKLYERAGAVCLVRDGRRARHIGPLFAHAEPQAAALIDDVARREQGPLIIDLFDANTTVLASLLERGFVSERPFLRMRRGPSRHCGERSSLVASAGPEFG